MHTSTQLTLCCAPLPLHIDFQFFFERQRKPAVDQELGSWNNMLLLLHGVQERRDQCMSQVQVNEHLLFFCSHPTPLLPYVQLCDPDSREREVERGRGRERGRERERDERDKG